MIKKGFTLVELMIAVLILGILVAIAIPRIRGSAFRAGVNTCRNNVDVINSQIELYYSRTGSWPVDIGEVIKDPNLFPDGLPKCPFEKPYIFITTNGKNRVLDHIHLDRKEVKAISEKILPKE